LNITELNLFRIYLHDRGHFFPGNANLYGSVALQSNMARNVGDPPTQTLAYYEMMLFERIYLDLATNPCHHAQQQGQQLQQGGWNACYERFLETKLGCAVPWQRFKTGSVPDCDTKAQERETRPN
jgi:hypothetical protein